MASEVTHTAGLRVTYQTENNMLNTIILNPIQKREHMVFPKDLS